MNTESAVPTLIKGTYRYHCGSVRFNTNQELTFHFNADPDTNPPSPMPKKGFSSFLSFFSQFVEAATKRQTMLGKSYLFPLQNSVVEPEP
jgi:hypothetical protein